MNTRHPVGGHVTYYGDGPLVDHDGYAVEVAAEDDANLMHLKVALDADMHRAIRADLNPAAVAELRARCDAFLNDHQEQK
jgi:hypothetical protein